MLSFVEERHGSIGHHFGVGIRTKNREVPKGTCPKGTLELY